MKLEKRTEIIHLIEHTHRQKRIIHQRAILRREQIQHLRQEVIQIQVREAIRIVTAEAAIEAVMIPEEEGK